MPLGVLPYFLDEELHLGELVVVVLIENVGFPGDAGAVLQDEGCADAVEAVEADLREDGPADATFDHREAGGDVVDVETRVRLLDVLLYAPEACTLFKSWVGVALNARELVERCVRIFTGYHEADRLFGEKAGTFVSTELTADDGDVQFLVQELPIEIRRLVGTDIDIHRRGLLHVVL